MFFQVVVKVIRHERFVAVLPERRARGPEHVRVCAAPTHIQLQKVLKPRPCPH